jgi:V/A-type H+-transporting ATPase subunit K
MDQVFIALAAVLPVAIAAAMTAWVQSRIGAAGAGVLAEKPELRGALIVMMAIPETMVILGFVVSVLILMGG